MVSLRAIEPARAGTRAIGTRKTLGPGLSPGRDPKPLPSASAPDAVPNPRPHTPRQSHVT